MLAKRPVRVVVDFLIKVFPGSSPGLGEEDTEEVEEVSNDEVKEGGPVPETRAATIVSGKFTLLFRLAASRGEETSSGAASVKVSE